jgi:hypothetical protein
MRGYPNATAWAIAPRLTTKFKPVAAQFRRKSFVARDGDTDIADADLVFVQRLPAPEHKPWPGKVVMLINEQAQSQAEHTGLYFEAATELTYIGSPTAGANGDVTEMVMPGNLAVSFSGQDVRHGDGRQLQRLGLQPDVVARPTIAGMARGEDEVLAAARNWLKQRGYTRQEPAAQNGVLNPPDGVAAATGASTCASAPDHTASVTAASTAKANSSFCGVMSFTAEIPVWKGASLRRQGGGDPDLRQARA